MSNEINEEVKITEEKPKRSKKGLCIIAILALLVAAAICYIFIYRNNDKDDNDTNDNNGTNVKVLSESEYQDYINEYGDKVQTEAELYYVDNGKYPKFEDIKDNIKTRRSSVSCKKNIISVNGDIELSECSIEGYKYNSSIKYANKTDNSNSLSLTGKVVVDKTAYQSIKDGNVLEKNNIKVELKDYKVYVSDKMVSEYDTTINAYFMDNLVIIATYGTDEGSTKILFIDVNGNILKEISKINDNFALSDVNVGDDYYSFVIDGNKVYFGATVHPNGELVNENFDCLESSITDAIYYVTVDGTTISEPQIYDSMTLAQDSNGSEYCD